MEIMSLLVLLVSSLIMIMGFSTALLVIGSNISKVSSGAIENYTYYYESSAAHAIASSAINLCARAIYENSLWRGGISHKQLNGGWIDSCTVRDVGGQQVRMSAYASFQGVQRVVSCLLQPSSFSRYAYYTTTDMSGYWVTGDTCWGPLHINNLLNVAGKPVFIGRATTLNGIHRYTNPQNSTNALDRPVFKGGFDAGINVDLPSDFSTLKNAAAAGGRKITGGQDVYIEFHHNGKIWWKRDNNWGGGGWNKDDLSDFAPNGAFFAEGVNVHVRGEVHTRVTIGCGGTTGSNSEGNIWLDDDVYYRNDPRYGPSSDMLGLVAENKLMIADDADNHGPNNDYILMACVFSRSDGLWAEHYNTRGVEGKLTTVGSQVAKVGGYTGVFSGDPPVIIHGFKPGGNFYDERLMVSSPPFFPTTGNYEVLSWYE
jgi:hypothetical protein